MVQARSTERRWSRALQHEHLVRVQLQENTEALAKQMTRMEDEARQQFQGSQNGLPIHTASLARPVINTKTGSLKQEHKQAAKKHVTLSSGKPEIVEVTDGQDDEDDQFFDAPEISDKDWIKASSTPSTPTPPESQRGHKRNISTVSVNEAYDLVASSSGEDHDNHPVNSDKNMAVSCYYYAPGNQSGA